MAHVQSRISAQAPVAPVALHRAPLTAAPHTVQHAGRRSTTVAPARRMQRTVAQAAVATPPPAWAPPPADDISLEDVKASLLDSLFGTERGLNCSSEVRAEINELINQLEARNPTPNPNEAMEKLSGRWKLVYTSNSELMALLALTRLPFVTVGDITQSVDAATLSVQNKVALSVPFSRTAFSTQASFEVRSPSRLQVKFEQGVVGTPQLLQDVEIPPSISLLGQPVDLTRLREALTPVTEGARSALGQVASFVARQPDLKFPIPSSGRSQTWLLNTYLDEDTRISRGDGGSVFIMVKDVSISPVSSTSSTNSSSTTAVSTTLAPTEVVPGPGTSPPPAVYPTRID